MIDSLAIEKINEVVMEHGLDEVAVIRLRKLWPDIHFTYCMDDDISGAKPVHESAAFNVYLVDGSEHCLKFTSDYQAATGLVLAEVEDETGI